MKIVELDLSDSGRCFVVGEVSGHFFALKQMLRELDFDPDKDILVLNGNFTGYCLSSRDLTAWLDKPWVIALLGRSEVELLSRLEGGAKPSLVGQWLGMLSGKEKGKIRDILIDKPLVAQIEYQGQLMAVSHASVPAGSNWDHFRSALLDDQMPLEALMSRFSDRHSDLQHLGAFHHDAPQPYPVQGLLASLSSFRDEGASDRIGRSANRYFLRCSAHMDHGSNYQHSCILPYIDIHALYCSEVNGIWQERQSTTSDDYQKTSFHLKQRYISVR